MRWILTAVGLLSFTLSASQAEEFSFCHENVLGTSLELEIDAHTSVDAEQAEKAVLAEIERLDGIFSSYNQDSDLCRFASAPLDSPQILPRELLAVMVASDQWQMKTGGAFNPLVAEMAALWQESAAANEVPNDAQLETAVASTQRPAWAIAPSLDRATHLHPGRIDLNAIAKGYIIDQATQAAMKASPNIEGAVVAVGGDLRVGGHLQETVGIADPWAPADNAPPLLEVRLQNQAIATSGSHLRGFDIHGTHYSHILDPRTGHPVSGEVKSASVIAEDAATADALATALMVMPIDEGLALINGLDHVECLIVGDDHQQHRSAQFDSFLDSGSPDARIAAGWTDGFELTVDFELNHPEARSYERPYVAAWLEDSKGELVKTLCLWVQKRSHFVKTLRRWVQIAGTDWEHIDLISRPTRMPGQYTLSWDGVMEDGQAIPEGEYMLFIEAAREHGSYQLMRQPLLLGAESQKWTLEGNVEVKSALVTFGPPRR